MSRSAERSRRRPRVARILAGLAVVLAALVVGAAPAQAHAVLVRSDPSNGASLPTAPATVHLWFDEDLAANFRSAQLVDGAGRTVGGARLGAGGPRDVVLDLPALTPGSYGVLWQVLSDDDGHATSGAVVFTIGGAGGPATPVRSGASASSVSGASAVSGADIAVRTAQLLAAAGATGALAVALLVLTATGTAAAAARRRVLLLATACAVLGLAVSVVALVIQSRRLAGDAGGVAQLVAGTRWGTAWLLRCAGFAAAAALAVRLLRGGGAPTRGPGAAVAVSGAAVAALALADALGGHPASTPGGTIERITAIAVTAVHAACAFTWLGALPALLVVLVPPRAELLAACRVPFARLAGGSAVLAVATGLVAAGLQLGDAGSLPGTDYGRSLLVKVTAVGVLLAAGGASARRWRGRRPARAGVPSGPGRPRSGVLAVEILAGLVVVAAAAVLAGVVPARSVRPLTEPAAAAPAPSPASTAGTSGDLVVSVSASPGRAGVNGFTAVVASTRRPAPAPVAAVTLVIEQAGRSDEIVLRRIAPERWFGTGVLVDDAAAARSGDRERILVDVRRAGTLTRLTLDRPALAPPTAAAPTAPPVDVTTGRSPLAGPADALALLVLAAAAGAVLRLRRRARDDTPGPPAASPAPEDAPILEDVR